MFNAMDADKSGEIDFDEFSRVCKAEDEADVRKLFEMLDRDGGGTITVRELTRTLRTNEEARALAMQFGSLKTWIVVQTKQTMERYNVATLLDKYSNLCLGIILLVLYESMWIKQRLNGSRWGFDAAALMVDIKVNRSSPDFVAAEQVDTGATVVTGLWMLPNLALYWPWMRKRVMFRAFGLNRTWDDVLDFLDHESTPQPHNSQDKDPNERKMSRHQSEGGVLVNENKDGQPEGLENRQLARPQSRGDHSGGRFESAKVSPEP